MRPVLGDKVLFTFAHDKATDKDGQSRTVPAVVVNVFNDECVNLRVFQDGPAMPLWETSILHKESLPEGSNASYWDWPATA